MYIWKGASWDQGAMVSKPHAQMLRSSGWQPWYSLETLKVVQPSTSPVNTKAVNPTTFPFLCTHMKQFADNWHLPANSRKHALMAPPYKTMSKRQCQVWAAQWWNFSAPVSSQWWAACCSHYNDFIMGTIASQITSLTIVYSTVYSEADQRKHQSSASLTFVRGIHRGPVNSPHQWPVTRKMFPFDDVIMVRLVPIHFTDGPWANV